MTNLYLKIRCIENIKHKKDSTFISKIVCDSILTLPIHAYMSP